MYKRQLYDFEAVVPVSAQDGNGMDALREELIALAEPGDVYKRQEQYKTPEALDRNFVKKYIEQVVVTFLGDRQAEISLTMKTEE